jgi:hypothetical protein
MWQELLHNKYIKDKTLPQVQGKPTDLPFWKGLIWIKNDLFTRGSFKVENGTSVRFLGGYLVRKYAASRSVPVIIQHCAKEECPSYRCSLT